MKSLTKEDKYRQLVDKFINYSFLDKDIKDIINPYHIKFPESQKWRIFKKINPWELWHGSLDAEILFIGQDFSNQEYFIENFKNDWQKERSSPTNISLRKLFSILNYNIGLPGDTQEQQALPLYFTNAVLGIKQNGMASAIKQNWYTDTANLFTKELINIIEPPNIIVMGKHAYNMICRIYNIKKQGILADAINSNGDLITSDNRKIFVVAHCSGLGKRNRSFEQQKEDWKKVKNILPTGRSVPLRP